jgi:hypothetical protein
VFIAPAEPEFIFNALEETINQLCTTFNGEMEPRLLIRSYAQEHAGTRRNGRAVATVFDKDLGTRTHPVIGSSNLLQRSNYFLSFVLFDIYLFHLVPLSSCGTSRHKKRPPIGSLILILPTSVFSHGFHMKPAENP